MKTSPRGIAALAAHEGVVPAPYLDSAGVWTAYIGHTASAGPPNPGAMQKGNPTDMEAAIREAFLVFAADLAKFEARVNDAVTVPLAQHEFDALVSFDFNTGGIYRAKLTQAINRGDRIGAANGFMGWLKPPEIRRRREAEQLLFRGIYPEEPIAVYAVTASNRPGAVVRTLTAADALGYLAPEQPSTAERFAAVEALYAALEARTTALEARA